MNTSVRSVLFTTTMALVFSLGACRGSVEDAALQVDEALAGKCGTFRWSIKTATDADASKVNVVPIDATVSQLVGLPAPNTLPSLSRISPYETETIRLRDITLQQFKLEPDRDVHLVVSDGAQTMDVELPSPSCVAAGGPFGSAIAQVRAAFMAKYNPTSSFQKVNDTISLVGIGFFDSTHGQTGGAGNGAELHPVIDLCFGKGCALGPTPDGGGGGQDGGGQDGGAGSLAAIKNVFVIVMENHNWSAIKGNASAPYINNTLLPMGAHAESYANIPGVHPSEPNYLWLEAGTNFGVKDDKSPASNHLPSTEHLVNQLEAAGVSRKAYAEGIDGLSCPVSNVGLYAPKHTPFVFFDDVINNRTRCVGHVRPYTELAGDLANGNVARYTFITPDLCNDMHNSSGCATTNAVANGDTWLSHELPKILASSAYKNGGLILLTWDESEQGEHPIGLVALSPFAKPGYSNTLSYSHSSTLRTVQTIFGVGPFLGDAANATDLSDLFETASTPPPADAGKADGATSDGAADAGSDAEPTNTCTHPICSVGVKLAVGCDPCATQVCALDAFCCASRWDATCVSEVASTCSHACN